MTSQIAILSMYGAAVASDTVVTSFRGGNKKVTPNSSKIVELGSAHKVLVLNSGSLNLNTYPHELHLREWSKTLPGPLPTLAAYVQSYEDWSKTESKFTNPGSITQTLERIASAAAEMSHDWLQNERANMDAADIVNTRKVNAQDKKELEAQLAYFESQDDYASISRSALKNQLSNSRPIVRTVVQDFAQSTYPPISKPNIGLMEKVVEHMVGKPFSMDGDSTLGFIGFGFDEHYPACIVLHCRGVFAGNLLATKDPLKITEEDGGYIQYFAQYDNIWGFTSGIHPDMRTEAIRILRDLDLPLGSEANLVEKFSEALDEASSQMFINPLFHNLGAFSILEMTGLADSLVSLQVLSSTIFDSEVSTVGGTIEVASIDLERGVTWHRRLPSTKLAT